MGKLEKKKENEKKKSLYLSRDERKKECTHKKKMFLHTNTHMA